MFDPSTNNFYVPPWLTPVLGALFGAGGVKMLSVWLENRRLTKKDFRETLLERIRELETVVANMTVRIGNLRVEVAHLEAENAELRRAAGLPPSRFKEKFQDNDEPPARESHED